MPRGDRTGRSGMGPMTGRGMGFCAGYDMPGYANTSIGNGVGRSMDRGVGRGMGMGRGMGTGCGRGVGRGMAYRHGAGCYQVGPMAREKSTAENVKWDIGVLEKELSALKERFAALTKEQES